MPKYYRTSKCVSQAEVLLEASRELVYLSRLDAGEWQVQPPSAGSSQDLSLRLPAATCKCHSWQIADTA